MHVHCSTSVYGSLFALLALSVVEPSVSFINCTYRVPPTQQLQNLLSLVGTYKMLLFFIYSVFPRAPFTLLTLLSATVKIFRFKLAEKFLLEELTYQIFMMTSESRGIATCHSNIRSRQAARACTFPREIFTHAV